MDSVPAPHLAGQPSGATASSVMRSGPRATWKRPSTTSIDDAPSNGAIADIWRVTWSSTATRMPYPTDGSHVAPLDADTDATTRTGPSQPAKACTSARVYVRPFPMSLVGAVVVVRSARS